MPNTKGVRSPSVGRPCAATALFRRGLPSTHAARPAQSERTPVWNALSTNRLVCRTLLSQRSPAFIHATRPAQRERTPYEMPRTRRVYGRLLQDERVPQRRFFNTVQRPSTALPAESERTPYEMP